MVPPWLGGYEQCIGRALGLVIVIFIMTVIIVFDLKERMAWNVMIEGVERCSAVTCTRVRSGKDKQTPIKHLHRAIRIKRRRGRTIGRDRTQRRDKDRCKRE